MSAIKHCCTIILIWSTTVILYVSLMCVVKWRIDGGVNRLVVQSYNICKIVSNKIIYTIIIRVTVLGFLPIVAKWKFWMN